MENFHWNIGTEVYFGRGQIARLGEAAAPLGRRALILYGGGSVKRNGIFAAAAAELERVGIAWTELGGVEPNPRVETVRRGAALCRETGAELLLAIGGGSVIDCAKAIAGCVFYAGEPWDLISGKVPYPEKFLPVVAVPTLAATGSEMDHIAVISNPDTGDKIGTRHPAMRPRAAILDPTYTFTVNAWHTAAGTADIFAHALENDLGPRGTESCILDGFAVSVLRSCVKYGPIALQEPQNYEARAELMWAGTTAINGLLSLGKNHPWTAHAMEHPLSACYDVTHGAGLAALLPAWLSHILDRETAPRLAALGRGVFDLSPTGDAYRDAQAGIQAMRGFFFGALGLPDKLSALGVSGTEHLAEMAQKAVKPGAKVFRPLTAEDVLAIYQSCY